MLSQLGIFFKPKIITLNSLSELELAGEVKDDKTVLCKGKKGVFTGGIGKSTVGLLMEEKSGRDFTFSETASRLLPRDLTWAGICLQASSTLFHQDLRENISDFKLKIVVTTSFTH